MNIKWPKISIITPSYNQGRFIEQTILSILNQNYPNLEYIIIDGGSTDNTVEIIKKYESQINYWISEPDQGQTDAINKGFKIATGEIFNWLNSDDYYTPGALFEVAQAFINGADCVAGYIKNFIEVHSAQDWLERTELYADEMETAARSANRQPGTFFNLDQLRPIFPLPESLHYTMDQYLWVSFLLQYGQEKIKLIDTEIVNFRRHSASKTQSNVEIYRLAYSEIFYNDLNSVFYNLASQFCFKEEAQIIGTYFSEKYKYSSYTLPISRDRINAVRTVLHLYLLELVLDDYARQRLKHINLTLSVIDRSALSPPSQKRLLFLKFKKRIWTIILLRRKLLNLLYP